MKKSLEDTVLLLILLFSFFIRIYNLENYPRWYVDEGTYANTGLNIMKGIWGDQTWGSNFFPPLFNVVLGILLTVFGKSYFVLRMTGVILGTLSVLLIYLIGKKLYNKNIGIIASVLLSITTFYINRMAFMDNLVEFFFLLTIYSYIQFEKNRKWLYILGISMGLSFLSKYTGLISFIFVLFIGFYEKTLSKLKISFLIFFLISFTYPLLGILFGWDEFLFDTLYQVQRKLADNIFLIFTFQPPYYFLKPSFSEFYFLTFVGFISVLYIAVRKSIIKYDDKNNKFILLGFLSIVLISFIAKHVWWVYLVIFYPIYVLATAIIINDALIFRKVIPLVVLSTLVLLKLLFLNKTLLIFSLSMIITIIYFVNHKIKSISKISDMFFSALIILSILFFSFSDITKITQNSVSDLREILSFVNSHVKPNDLVASNPNVMWLINGTGIDYSQMAFYTTKLNTDLYPEDLYPRFKENITLSNFKYIILDCPKWLKFNVGESESVKMLTPIIMRDWNLIKFNNKLFVFEKQFNKKNLDDFKILNDCKNEPVYSFYEE